MLTCISTTPGFFITGISLVFPALSIPPLVPRQRHIQIPHNLPATLAKRLRIAGNDGHVDTGTAGAAYFPGLFTGDNNFATLQTGGHLIGH